MIKHIPEKNRVSSEGLFSSFRLFLHSTTTTTTTTFVIAGPSSFVASSENCCSLIYSTFPLKLHCTAQPQFREVLVYLLTFVKQKSKKKITAQLSLRFFSRVCSFLHFEKFSTRNAFSLPLRCERPTFERYFAIAARICDWLIYGREIGRAHV